VKIIFYNEYFISINYLNLFTTFLFMGNEKPIVEALGYIGARMKIWEDIVNPL